MSSPRRTRNKLFRISPFPPRWSATWRHRLAGDGGAAWQQAGASGPQDSEEIRDTHGTAGDKEVAIDGLGSAVQFMADHPCDNHGMAIQFQNASEFFSSRAAIGRPRLELELEPAPAASGPDLSITSISRGTQSGATPAEGEEVTYSAHVKNVGDAKSAGFTATWVLDGRIGAGLEINDGVRPQRRNPVVTTKRPFHLDKLDHRVQTVELRIVPKGPDAVAGNNDLQVFANAKQIDVQVPDAIAKRLGTNLIGSSAIEDWVQAQVRVFNEVYAAQSRFSFAPDGAKERVSVQHIYVGGAAPKDGAHADGVAVIPDNESAWESSDPAFLRSIGLAIGLPDYKSMNFPAGKRILLKTGDKTVDRGTSDIYPGLMGYGDTRYEGVLAGAIALMYEPYAPPTSGALPLIPTGLLSATDVALLNAHVERRDGPLPMPKTSLVRATDLTGHPLSNMQLDFFQSKGGQIDDGPPTFSVTTGQNVGSALLSNKEGQGPFGKLDPDGGNGVFLIRATANGVTEYGWLKAWEFIDTASRGNTAAGILDVRLDLPSAALDTTTDLARDRIISDSTNLLPAKLGTLVAGTTDTEVSLGGKAGDWVEIDLGRDRTIGEVTLFGATGTFWPQFEIQVYATGQKLEEATLWANELNWNWAATNRRDLIPGDPNTISVAYRSPSERIRFIRITNRSSVIGKLKGIRVVPVKISQ